MVRARLLLLLVATAWGCGEDRECTFDVDCPIGRRCVATRCIPVQLAPLRDASAGQDAGGDAASPPDSGPSRDAGPDASVNLQCGLQLEPVSGSVIASASGPDETPLMTRSGIGLLGVVVREQFGVVAWYVDETGATVLDPGGSVDDGTALGDFAVTAAPDGSLLVVYRAADDRLHGGLATDVGIVSLGELTDPATGTIAPAVARAGFGYVIAWADRSSGTEQISTRSLDDLRVPSGAASSLGTPAASRLPSLADVDVDDVPVAWSDSRDGTPQPYAGVRRPDGSVSGERAIASAQVAGEIATVSTPFGTFLSWVEPPAVPGGQGQVHISRVEGADLRDRVVARQTTLDSRTSIAWDGDRIFVAWHRGIGDAAQGTVAVVGPSLNADAIASLTLPTSAVHPTVAADDTLRAVVWIEPTTNNVWFGKLSCGNGN